MNRARNRSRILALAAVALLLTASATGCGYMVTYDDAFPPEPIDFPRWDPPDSIAFVPVNPPPVEAVILDAYLYYLIHPEGERKAEEAAARRAARPRTPPSPSTGTPADAPDTSLAILDPEIPDSLAVADTLAGPPPDTTVVIAPLPPIQVDLTTREEDVLTRRARVDLEQAEILLRVIQSEGKDTTRRREHITSIQGFVSQARAALERRDFQGAANLALKARILAESVAGTKP